MEGQGNPLVKKDNSLAGQNKNLATQDGSSTEKKKQASGRKGPSKEHFTYDYQVRLYPDGKYHWLYDLHMLKNPAVLFEVFRVFAISIGIIGVFMFVIISCEDGVSLDSTVTILKIVGLMAAIFLGLCLIGYPLYAALLGWKYTVHFTMDEKGLVHQQTKRPEDLAQKIGCLTVLVGLLARRPGVAGAGMLAANRTAMSTEFGAVRKVKAVRWMHLIRVNETLSRNQVYVDDADFEFVYNFICRHCQKAKIK